MGITDIRPIRYERMKSNSNKPGLVKVELRSPEEKRALLRAKRKLRETLKYKDVFIRSSQTYAERIMRSNLKTILAEIPSGSEYKLTANGRILKNEQLGSQPDEQSVACEDRDSGDNTRDDKDSQNNHMEPTGEVQPSNVKECTQSDDLMEAEESKSQANLDPTLQYSEQLKASNPALSEETAKDLGILAHSLSEGLNNMFKDMFKSNGDSWRLAEEKEGNS